jgi:hypothetical protein
MALTRPACLGLGPSVADPHLISDLEAVPLENGEVEAKTAFLVYRSHLKADHQLLSGCREDELRKVNGAWNVGEAHDRAPRQRPARENLSVFLYGSKAL